MSDTRHSRRQSDDARLIDAAVRERLSVAAADLAVPDTFRLTEWQRTTLSALILKLVRTIEDELRASLAASLDPARQGLLAALSSAHVPIALPILQRAGLFRDQALLDALMRRVEEHRRFRGGSSRLLTDLVRDGDEAVSEQAMAIIIAQSRRFDRFAEPIAADTELPAEIEHRLVWRIAAALRVYIIEQHQVAPAEADEAVSAAAGALLARYDEGESLEARSLRLASLLDARGRLTDNLIEAALAEGMLPLFIAALAARAALSYQSAWAVLSDPMERGPVLLLRSGAFGRDSAAAILLSLSSSAEAAAAQLDRFDVTAPAEAQAALRVWQVDPAYREAVSDLSPEPAAA